MTGAERKVAVLLFPGAEPLDYAGPFEVFAAAGRRSERVLFEPFTVAEAPGLVKTRGGLRVVAEYGFGDCPTADILVVPGGFGTRSEMHNLALLDWIRSRAASAEAVLSVCTGALLLGAAGLLDGARATTHFGALDLLTETAPAATICSGSRFLDNGKIVVAAGVSAGIDATLYLVGRVAGAEAADECARYMEYDWVARTAD